MYGFRWMVYVYGRRGLKRIKVTRCNRMALRVCVCVCVCVCVYMCVRTGAPSLAELFKLCEPLQGIFSLSRHARSLALSPSLCFSFPPYYTLYIPFIPVFGYTVTAYK